MDLTGKKVVVTGATGFIGGRLCEALTLGEERAQVIALARNVGRAARIGRLPLRILRGDILDKKFVALVVRDADIVIHLATGGRPGIVHGTKNLIRAAAASSVQKFIHMSSAAVYGLKAAEAFTDECAPLYKTGNPYSDAKAKAERVVSRYMQRRVPAVILRPRIVFGPYSSWVDQVWQEAKGGRVTLVNEGGGACNTVYVDNLVHAILLAIKNSAAVGQTFFVTDDERVTWRDFKLALAADIHPKPAIVNVAATVAMGGASSKEGFLRANLAGFGRFLFSKELRTALDEIPIAKKTTDELLNWFYSFPEQQRNRIKHRLRPAQDPSLISARDDPSCGQDQLLRESGRGFTSVTKIKEVLGYKPVVSFREGVEITREWLRWKEAL